MRVRRNPEVFDAVKWDPDTAPHPDVVLMDKWRLGHGSQLCPVCRHPFSKHGEIKGTIGRPMICPGDFILTDSFGEKRPLAPDIVKGHFVRVPEVCPACKDNKPVEAHPNFLCERCIVEP